MIKSGCEKQNDQKRVVQFYVFTNNHRQGSHNLASIMEIIVLLERIYGTANRSNVYNGDSFI
jgi:hypothetical protein